MSLFSSYLGATNRRKPVPESFCNFLQNGDATFSNFVLQLSVLLLYNKHIIPKELFYRVQEEKARRPSIYTPAAKRKDTGAKIRYSSNYALSDILTCGECGHPYRRQVWSKYGIKKAMWRCDSRLKNGTKMCRHSPTLQENTLHEAVMTAINSVVEDRANLWKPFGKM